MGVESLLSLWDTFEKHHDPHTNLQLQRRPPRAAAQVDLLPKRQGRLQRGLLLGDDGLGGGEGCAAYVMFKRGVNQSGGSQACGNFENRPV